MADLPNNSITEAAVDRVVVDRILCAQAAGSGRVNDLVLEKAGGQLGLSWGASCQPGDVDYGIYEGALGDFASHGSRSCSTGGATSTMLDPSPGDRYYLVVPADGIEEGSYGMNSAGIQRSQAQSACAPQNVAACGF